MFQIAKKLGGMTVDELSSRMSVEELFEWAEIFRLEAAEQKRAMERAQANQRRR